MRVTLSIPDAVARRFQALIPPQRRSVLVTKLLENELAKHEQKLMEACKKANQDQALEKEIDEWQSFDDNA